MSFTIEPLQNHIEHLPVLAAWHQQQWGSLNPAKSVESRIGEFQGHLGPGAIPSTWCAVQGGELLGSASLIDCDLESRADLHPWLASVFVAPEHRSHGAGSQLVKKVMAAAAETSPGQLYLYTIAKEKWYQHLGWQIVERTEHNGHDIVIMSYDTSGF